MARTVTVKLGGQEWHMPASYKASREIAEVVEDPLRLCLKIEQRGEIDFTVEMVVDIIYIGCKAAGCGLTKDQVGEAIMEAGVATYIEPIGKYIASLVMGGPERPLTTAVKKTGTQRGKK